MGPIRGYRNMCIKENLLKMLGYKQSMIVFWNTVDLIN